ncbi:MAG: hypothetical protein WCT04_07130 [Planctomycetota bacterium]
MKSNPFSSIACVCASLACVIVFSGCEDLEARMAAQESNRLINELRVQIDSTKKKNDDAEASIKELKTSLQRSLDERVDKIEASIAATQKRLLEQIGSDVKMSRDAATGLADTARQDNDKELKATKQMVAENMQAIRAESAAEFEKVRKFMDNQLKELYPYAYQPRRVEAGSPPGEPAADTRKKAEEQK